MTTADDIFDQSAGNIQRLGLREIPFTESPTDLESETLGRIFTGRENELRQVFNLFQSRERRRILIYGWIGIGKSAFLLEVLSVLRRKRPQMLTTYTSLRPEIDLATTATIALARAMPKDEWAERLLYQMGITNRVLKERSSEIGANLGLGGKIVEKDLPAIEIQYPAVHLEILLERARELYPEGVVIGIDDLDKQNPSQVRQMMHAAQGMLKGPAWYLLTGHPMGIPEDLLTSGRGLFDLQLKLEELDPQTTYQMLINYLSSARLDNDCTDPTDSRSVLPFLPETARHFCKASLGKPRLFNRLGNTVLSVAANLQVDTITPEVLRQGLKAAAPTLQQRAVLSVQEERVQMLLQEQGSLSEETITVNELEKMGFRSFSEILPLLEKLEQADLAYQPDRGDIRVFAPIPLLSENLDKDEDTNEIQKSEEEQ